MASMHGLNLIFMSLVESCKQRLSAYQNFPGKISNAHSSARSTTNVPSRARQKLFPAISAKYTDLEFYK